jgi:hypothetical protein
MELDKAFKLINHILKTPVVTSKSIKEAFNSEIDIRTAQRYKCVLEKYPEYIMSNPDGSISLKDNTAFRGLTLDGLAANLPFKDGEEAVLEKTADNGKIIIRSGSFIPYDDVKHTIDTLADYLQVQTAEIEYKKKRVAVNPYLIILTQGFWRLIGFCEEKNKAMSFRLDKIKGVRPLSPARYFKVSETVLNGMTAEYADEKEAEVTVSVASDAAFFFKNRSIFSSQKILEEKPDGLMLSFKAADKFDFTLQAAPWACFIKIISPKKYKAAFTEYLKYALRKNC